MKELKMTIKTVIKSAYIARDRKRFQTKCGKDTLPEGAVTTEQHHKEAVMPKNIIKKYSEMGVLNQIANLDSQFGDVSEVLDLQEKLNLYHDVKQRFESLPADVRKSFDHDPFKLLNAIEDEKQHEKLIDLGLMHKKPEPGVPEEPVKASEPVSTDSGTKA